MAFSISTSAATSNLSIPFLNPKPFPLISFSSSLSYPNPRRRRIRPLHFCCHAARQQQQQQQQQRSSNPVNKKRKKKSNHNLIDKRDDDFKSSVVDTDEIFDEEEQHNGASPLPLPKPPAGFVVDDQGIVLAVSNKRLATIVDSTNNYPLECIIRRVFRSSRGDECMLLCPVDTPVQIMKSTNFEGWSAVSDEEVESILPTAAYALAKIHMHLVYSGFCYTARGGFCYTEDNIFEFRTDDGEDIDGLPAEGVEITSFHLDGSHYMIYTPSDPLLFVAMKDRDGHLQIADDELLEDPATVSSIDEETEFNALVEEEAALLESLLGER